MENFASLYSHDFVRIASCVPHTKVADVPANLAETVRLAKSGGAVSAAIMVFPELGLSSYAIEDLLFQDALLTAVEAAIDELVNISRGLYPVLIVGAPLRSAGALFNTAVVIRQGSVLGVVPKTYLPNYREFYEQRHLPLVPAFTDGKSGSLVARRRSVSTFCFDRQGRSMSHSMSNCVRIFGRRCRRRPRRRWRVPRS
jgi:predicted amidohydrolase